MSCTRYRGELAAYLLGALDDSDRREVRAHLDQCGYCRADFEELAPLPGLLSRLSIDEVTRARVAPDPAFTDRIVRAAAARQRTRHRWIGAAAAAALLAGAVTTTTIAASSHTPMTTLRATNTNTGVHGSVEMLSRPVGTELDVSVAGLADHQWCVMVVIARDGMRQIAASWQATYVGMAIIRGTTAIPESQVRSIVVETDSGAPLLTFST